MLMHGAAILDFGVGAGEVSESEIRLQGAFQLKFPTCEFKWNAPLLTVAVSVAKWKKNRPASTSKAHLFTC